MKIWTCCAAAIFFVLIFTSLGGVAQMSPPAEGEEETAPLVKPEVTPGAEPPPAVTSPQGQGSTPTVGEQPATGSQATNPPSSPPLAKPEVTPGSEPPPAGTSPQGQVSAPTAVGQQPATDQQATTPQASPPVAGAEGKAPVAMKSQDTYGGSQAQQGTSPVTTDGATLTLKESIGIALEKSPTIQSAQSAIKGAEYQRRAAFSDFLPQVNTQYSYTRLDQPPFATISGTRVLTGTRDNYNWSTSVTQPVFTGGALINSYLLAKLGVDTAKVQFVLTKLDLALQVKQAYYTVLTTEKGLEVAQQAVAQLESHYTVAKAFFDVGITAKNDLLAAEVQLAQTRQNLITAEHNLEVARAVFNTLLRRDINEPVRLGESLEYTAMTINMNALYDEALRERPEIKLSELGIQSAKREVGIAASKLLPQVSIVYTYERLGDDPSVEGSRFQRMHDWNVMGVAQWTVWDWGKAWWGVGEQKAKAFQAQLALEQAKDSVKLDVQSAALTVTAAKKNIQVAETALGQAEEDFRINEERFKEQVGTTTDVLDSLTRLTQARTNYYTAMSDYNVAKARLLRAIGGM
jgi:outer membrane protein